MKHSFQGHEKFLVFKDFMSINTNSHKLIIIASAGAVLAWEVRWLHMRKTHPGNQNNVQIKTKYGSPLRSYRLTKFKNRHEISDKCEIPLLDLLITGYTGLDATVEYYCKVCYFCLCSETFH